MNVKLLSVLLGVYSYQSQKLLAAKRNTEDT